MVCKSFVFLFRTKKIIRSPLHKPMVFDRQYTVKQINNSVQTPIMGRYFDDHIQYHLSRSFAKGLSESKMCNIFANLRVYSVNLRVIKLLHRDTRRTFIREPRKTVNFSFLFFCPLFLDLEVYFVETVISG